ncbi:MAG: glycerophosphodiester phosphodiesterase [Acidobacteriota bacterium]|nr:glycerophosphodiester phosphodiesterase [Acidobacteriota bacterium]
MLKRRKKWLILLLLCGGLGGVAALLFMNKTGQPAAAHPFFTTLTPPASPLVIAHRGGAGLWPENTLHAFTQAAALGVDMLELDVHATADGVLVIIHDPTLNRTTDGTGAISQLTLAELQRLDAGYRWSPDGGKTYPHRGRGLTVPTLDEVLRAFPHLRFNIEPKQEQPSIVQPLCQMLRERGVTNRVIVGAFRSSVLEDFRRVCPEAATSASTSEASHFLALQRAGLADTFSPPMQALQVPETAGGWQVLTPDFIASAHRRNLQVHAWTINDVETMKRLIAAGVDGIMTDYPDRLLEVLGRGRK